MVARKKALRSGLNFGVFPPQPIACTATTDRFADPGREGREPAGQRLHQ